MKQRTIKKPIGCSGIGLHSGISLYMTLLPAPANTGIVFRRTDLPQEIAFVKALYNNVKDTNLCTSIANEYGTEVGTIEHLMAALWANKIDNVYVELNGPEVPSMDGSAYQFLFLIECAGIEVLEAPINIIEISQKLEVINNGSKISFFPSNYFSIEVKIDFKDKAIGIQVFTFSEENNSFKKEIARARTFGFFHEIEMLQANGLAKGGSLCNAVVIKNGAILNEEGLRYHNEFVRHKILDCIGDLYLAGSFIKGKIVAEKPGHSINNIALRKLFTTNSSLIANSYYFKRQDY